MLNNDKTGLLIFDNFHIDFNLPKWKKRESNVTSGDSDSISSGPRFNRFTRTGGTIANSGFLFVPENPLVINGIPVDGNVGVENKKASFFDKIFGREKKRKKLELERIQKEMQAPNFKIEEAPAITEEITPREFFESVKNSAEELKLAHDRFENYEKAIEHLKRTGQVAILERMEYELEIHRAETQLYATGFTKVITEDNVIEFAKKSCRDIRIDWIKNFTRLIPEKVIEAKEKCDANLIFDNYVVMHYDPYKDGTLKTLGDIKKEQEKDPILFGVISGSNKLYYIGDWIDEYCDLTFDKLVEKLGEDAIKANDLTVEVKITPR